MPINIFSTCENEDADSIALLCEDCWELPAQLAELERWVEKEGSALEAGSYVADIGFCPRSAPSGGGGHLTLSTMSILAAAGIELWFSEYPG